MKLLLRSPTIYQRTSQTVDQVLFISVLIKASRKSSKLATKLLIQMKYQSWKIIASKERKNQARMYW